MAIDSVAKIQANGGLTGELAAVGAAKDLAAYYAADQTPPGLRTNAVQWLQRQVMAAARELPRRFDTVAAWERFRSELRRRLPAVIGLPQFPPLQESVTRARVRVGNDVICERVDVYLDADYAIPAFVFVPAARQAAPLPACVWNPGWPESKFKPSYCAFGARMARQGVAVLVPDHAPFGETTFMNRQQPDGMTLIMGMGNVLGISQLAPRPLLVRSNLCDDWWPVSGFDDVEHFTRKIYRLYGVEHCVSFRAEVHEHDLTGPFADDLERFLLEQV